MESKLCKPSPLFWKESITLRSKSRYVFFFFEEYLWVWVQREVLGVFLKYSRMQKTGCWDQRCCKDKRSEEKDPVPPLQPSSGSLPLEMEENMTRVSTFTLCVMYCIYTLSVSAGMTTSDHLRVNLFSRIHCFYPPVSPCSELKFLQLPGEIIPHTEDFLGVCPQHV